MKVKRKPCAAATYQDNFVYDVVEESCQYYIAHTTGPVALSKREYEPVCSCQCWSVWRRP